MRYETRLSPSKRWLTGLMCLGAAAAMGSNLGCTGEIGGGDSPGGTPGGTGGKTGGTGPGGAGAVPVDTSPCKGAADSRLVVAPQRIMLLTKPEIYNTVAYLIDKTEADAIVESGMFSFKPESERHFPPSDGEEQNLNTGNISSFVNLAWHVGDYVEKNFATLSKCQTVTDQCATTWLNALAAKAYRRDLTAEERTRFSSLFTELKTQMVRGYEVTLTTQRAAGYAAAALMLSPQLVWRWEIGQQASTTPPGVYLTDNELASHVSFFLTDAPPDDMLLAAAKAGTLRMNLASHVSRIIQTPQAKAWLRHVMELYFLLNQLPTVHVDETKFPVFDSGLAASMLNESQMFLDHVLWGSNAKLNDLLLSRTGFVNTRLAEQVYKIPVPAGATLDNFVQTTLPADQRAGILTNAGFLTARSRTDGQNLVSRAKTVKAAFLCLISSPPGDEIANLVQAATKTLDHQTGQEQVASRAAVPTCAGCHASFDSYGLVLEFYDAVAAYRTTYDYLDGKPAIDGTTKLPPEVGGATVKNAVELAQNLADSPTFLNCVSKSMLQYAMTELNAFVELPLPSEGKQGCATVDVVDRYKSGNTQTFAGLVTAITQSPAFVVRRAVQ